MKLMGGTEDSASAESSAVCCRKLRARWYVTATADTEADAPVGYWWHRHVLVSFEPLLSLRQLFSSFRINFLLLKCKRLLLRVLRVCRAFVDIVHEPNPRLGWRRAADLHSCHSPPLFCVSFFILFCLVALAVVVMRAYGLVRLVVLLFILLLKALLFENTVLDETRHAHELRRSRVAPTCIRRSGRHPLVDSRSHSHPRNRTRIRFCNARRRSDALAQAALRVRRHGSSVRRLHAFELGFLASQGQRQNKTTCKQGGTRGGDNKTQQQQCIQQRAERRTNVQFAA
ncbi:hypothetical protein BC830DRAFT_1155841 [Chytriomyces sp. MP71]|nr:hypothetical protein BC830DRAFT_1155841 [Chytriomyces sp. MP71]